MDQQQSLFTVEETPKVSSQEQPSEAEKDSPQRNQADGWAEAYEKIHDGSCK